ncbi:hypothetical protein [Variovorax sp. HJSM1_2]|uniref:hypothetical protein n=1 Tax=Variovorax sp. HJSM1_2 TaxID=3366263 RepID=UPI003BDDA781
MTYSVEADLIASLPPGWHHRRLKEVCDVIPSNVDKLSVDGQAAVRLCNYVDTYKNERITASIDFMSATATQAQIERLSLKKGDITITKDSESPWDIAVPAFISEDVEGLVCGYHLSKIAPEAGVMDGGYLSWALRSKPVNLQFALAAQGITRYGLSSSALADGVVPCPPYNQQLAIASYLDAETKRIDGLIEAKSELANLIEESRWSALGHVLGGLDHASDLLPTASLFWAQRPAHWSEMRVKFLIDRIEQGWSPQAESGSAGSDEWGVLKAGACNGGVFREVENKALPPDVIPDPTLEIRPHDVLMSRGSGSVDLVGSVALVPDDVRSKLMLCDLMYRISVDQEIALPEWYVLTMNSAPIRRQIRLALRGAEGLTRKISIGEIKDLVVLVPPLAEQRSHIAKCRTINQRANEAIEYINSEIALLHELRSATITDAVLGRIDVRKYMKTE